MTSSCPELRISLNHLKDLPLYSHERPYELWLPIPDDKDRSNVEFEYCHDIPLSDARGREKDFDIETHGFTFLTNPTGLAATADQMKSAQGRGAVIQYLEKMSQFLQAELHSNRVLCYDWRVRQAQTESVSTSPTFYLLPIEGKAREYLLDVAQQVHADESPVGVQRILQYLLTADEKKELEHSACRLRLINLWRPIVPVVEDHALTVCDRRTVKEEDWEPVDKVHADWVEEGMYLRRRNYHKWYWLSRQTNKELLAFVVWDSARPNEYCASTPHCSFKMPGDNEVNGPRESIELRFLVWDKL